MTETQTGDAARRIDPIRPTDDDARELARGLLRSARSGSLSTLAADGHPYVSLVGLATDSDGTPLILTSRLAAHTGYLQADARASLLVARSGKGDPMAHPRMSIRVRARAIERDGEAGARIKRRYLAHQPKAALYADFPDFGFFALDIESASLNGGFAKAYDLGTADLLCDADAAAAVAETEAGAVSHMNEDHSDAVALYATRLLGARDGAWKLTGLDPHGADLVLGDSVLRLPFPTPARAAADVHRILVELARKARALPAPEAA